MFAELGIDNSFGDFSTAEQPQYSWLRSAIRELPITLRWKHEEFRMAGTLQGIPTN
jgi:hypothetical protein